MPFVNGTRRPGPGRFCSCRSRVNTETSRRRGYLVEQLEVAPEAAGWARILLERVRSLDDKFRRTSEARCRVAPRSFGRSRVHFASELS